ncbi:E3 ubiquitin-protein ligase CHIP-like [Rutidosis leptorrhynchoides]|uniref:E3 ubiquitin-protein ligase CHIP-like n=1 Tax=Rutidosis leptorrhynchoides TaxID=125765 RepID=UPI003A9A31A1
MAKGVISAIDQAEQLKQDGNSYFKKNRLGAAIDAYTEAITLCPNIPVYWTNRALCHRKRNDWARVEQDCLKAIQLDYKSVKGHYMFGLALLRKEKYAQGIKELQRALDLGRGAHPNSYMVEEIWQELATAKYGEWDRDSTKRNWDLRNLEESCQIALKEKHLCDASITEDDRNEITSSTSEQLAALKLVFSKAAEDDTPTEVPDYLCCKITLDIFRDPVITPSGLTYERAIILNHLDKVGKFDPTTRETLLPSQLIPNLAIKDAVEAFLEKHGWAYKTE